MHGLRRWPVPSESGLKCLHCVPVWRLLRDDGTYLRKPVHVRAVRCNWIFGVLCMRSGQLLRDSGPKRSNRPVCRRTILGCWIDHVHRLSVGQLLCDAGPECGVRTVWCRSVLERFCDSLLILPSG